MHMQTHSPEHTRTHAYTHTHTRTCIYIYIYLFIDLFIYVFTYLFIYMMMTWQQEKETRAVPEDSTGISTQLGDTRTIIRLRNRNNNSNASDGHESSVYPVANGNACSTLGQGEFSHADEGTFMD